MKLRCVDCDTLIEIPNDIAENEVVTCHSCGCEYIFNGSEFIQSELDGEDWGE